MWPNTYVPTLRTSSGRTVSLSVLDMATQDVRCAFECERIVHSVINTSTERVQRYKSVQNATVPLFSTRFQRRSSETKFNILDHTVAKRV